MFLSLFSQCTAIGRTARAEGRIQTRSVGIPAGPMASFICVSRLLERGHKLGRGTGLQGESLADCFAKKVKYRFHPFILLIYSYIIHTLLQHLHSMYWSGNVSYIKIPSSNDAGSIGSRQGFRAISLRWKLSIIIFAVAVLMKRLSPPKNGRRHKKQEL